MCAFVASWMGDAQPSDMNIFAVKIFCYCEALCGTYLSLALVGYSSRKEGETTIEFAQSLPAPILPLTLRP